MNHFCVSLLVIGIQLVDSVRLPADTLHPARTLELTGDLAHAEELSGVTRWRDFLVVCPDEGAEFNVLRKVDLMYDVISRVSLLADPDEEIDMEGITSNLQHVFVVGSHSIRRSNLDEDRPYTKNRKRFTRVRPHVESYGLYRITLGDEGQLLERTE